jgi:Icc-related predicted phosphoesterase
MIVTCLSDLHGHLPVLGGGDMLIIAGDIVNNHYDRTEYDAFNTWIGRQDFKHKIVIAGNHDMYLECLGPDRSQALLSNCTYLCDSGVEIEGLEVWGSPYTPTFFDWAFMADRGKKIMKHWAKIPDDTDILITHGPPWGMLDKTIEGDEAGCKDLKWTLMGNIRPQLHVFGHIHEGYGQHTANNITYVNASYVDYAYRPVNTPIQVEIKSN